MRRALLLSLLSLVLALSLSACGGDGEESSGDSASGCETVDAPAAKDGGGETAPTGSLEAGTTYELVVQTNCGDFTITLDPKLAPKTTASLVALAEDGFYKDTTFHRVVPGFVIQGGDPTGTGAGGPGYTTTDAPPTDTRYTEGTVAMAKSVTDPPGTSGSQFFVVTAPDAGLPPEYAVIGRVTEGMETVSAIEALGTGDGPPAQPIVIENVSVRKS
jgi:cyclophilin family peptidyl-prolyl cis-trans isomerase